MTIDTSREAVEWFITRLRGQRPLPSRNEVADELVALLAERDAALAEVARLSTPPDDAEVREAHREWFSTTYPHTYANAQCIPEAQDAFSFSEEGWAAATHAARRKD